MQTFLENKEVEPVEPVQMNTYQSNTYRKDFKLVTFQQWAKSSRQAAREGPTVLHIHFSSLSKNSKYQPAAPAHASQQYFRHGRIVDL